MRILLVLLAILPFQNTVFSQASKTTPVLEAEQRRFEAMTRRDTVLLRTLLAEDMLYIHSNAMVETKAQHLAAISSGKLNYQQMRRENPAVRRYGKIAMVYGLVKAKGINQGTVFELNLLATAVYRKKKGVWLLVNWQSTKVNN